MNEEYRSYIKSKYFVIIGDLFSNPEDAKTRLLKYKYDLNLYVDQLIQLGINFPELVELRDVLNEIELHMKKDPSHIALRNETAAEVLKLSWIIYRKLRKLNGED